MRIQRRATAVAPTPPLSVQQAPAPASIARGGRVSLDIPGDVHQHYFGRGRRRYRVPRFSDRTIIYRSVLDTNAKIKDKDRPKLRSAIQWAIRVIRKAQASKTMLTRILGSKESIATLVHEAAHLADGAIEVQFALVKYRKDLLGDSTKDRALTDWLVANYGKAFY